LLSHGLWQRRFGGDSGVIGRQFGAYVSDRPSDPDLFTIVGILPANFWHLNPYTEILTPLRAPSYPYLVSLREGISPAVAQQRITDLVRQGQGGPATQLRVELRSVHTQYTRTIRPILLALAPR
jgi:putative ABC transport system permease protein